MEHFLGTELVTTKWNIRTENFTAKRLLRRFKVSVDAELFVRVYFQFCLGTVNKVVANDWVRTTDVWIDDHLANCATYAAQYDAIAGE